MKMLNKLSIFLLIALAWGISSCDQTKLTSLLDNPNTVTPDNASINDLYNKIQIDFDNFMTSNGGFTFPATMARERHTTAGFTYNDFFGPSDFNFTWRVAYSGIFPDVQLVIDLAAEKGLDVHAGTVKIIKAYVMLTLVDIFGNVPFSEAGQGTDVISPVDDPGDQVYAAAGALLDEAIAQLSGTTAAPPRTDIFYGGDVSKWITLAKTMKLKIALTTRLVNSKAKDEINAVVSGGDLIDEASEDFQFQYSTNRVNPDARSPHYAEHYESDDGGYMANYFMWLLQGEKLDADENPVKDPRIRFYFYRQVSDALNQDLNTYSCIFSDLPDQSMKPQHYIDIDPRMPYCALEDGYSGRDHLNGSGIPPDGPIRTVWGLYPAGGKFDDNSFSGVQNSGTDGGLGAGIDPLLLSSFVDFMRAEAALTLGTNDDPRAMLESGINASMAKVFSFKSLVAGDLARVLTDPVTGEQRTVEESFVPSDSTVQAYVDFVLNEYDNAANDDEKLNIIMKEYLIALWGNGIEAYNNYRRTGKPDKIQPTLEPASGAFARSAFLPAVHVDFNANATQKAVTDKVFWDDGSATVY